MSLQSQSDDEDLAAEKTSKDGLAKLLGESGSDNKKDDDEVEDAYDQNNFNMPILNKGKKGDTETKADALAREILGTRGNSIPDEDEEEEDGFDESDTRSKFGGQSSNKSKKPASGNQSESMKSKSSRTKQAKDTKNQKEQPA